MAYKYSTPSAFRDTRSQCNLVCNPQRTRCQCPCVPTVLTSTIRVSKRSPRSAGFCVWDPVSGIVVSQLNYHDIGDYCRISHSSSQSMRPAVTARGGGGGSGYLRRFGVARNPSCAPYNILQEGNGFVYVGGHTISMVCVVCRRYVHLAHSRCGRGFLAFNVHCTNPPRSPPRV